MILTYKPAGSAEPQTWVLDLGKLRVAEMEGIERRTKMPYGTEFKQNLLMGNASARRALLWTVLRREHHTLRYEDVDFADDEVLLEMDRDEWAAAREAVERSPRLSEEERAEQLAAIDAAAAEAPEPPGKASTPSTTSEMSTG